MTTDTRLFHYVIRLDKKDSAFFYFQLEANEGLCFYSTLPFNPHEQFRDIDLKGDLKLQTQVEHILAQMEKKFPIHYKTYEVLSF